MDLKTALQECDLATIAKIANVGRDHTAGDRFALLQKLFVRITDSDMRDRLEDISNIIAQQPHICEHDTKKLVASTKREIEKEYGPYYTGIISVEALFLGFLKEPSPQDRQKHYYQQLLGDLDLKVLDLDKNSQSDCKLEIPPLDYFIALCQKLVDCLLGDSKCTIHPSLIGNKSFWGNHPECPLCNGFCSTCKGKGIMSDDRIHTMIAKSTLRKQIRLSEVSKSNGGKITYKDLRAIFGGRIDCPDCHGTGSNEQCSCAIYIDVPPKAHIGWVCRFTDTQGVTLQHVRIEEILD